jgi:tetratricopeptide (TPR) repeat protein
MKRFVTLLLLVLMAAPVLDAQSEKRSVRRGNRAFGREKYEKAEILYKKAQLADSLSHAAGYNLGNTYYRMENYPEADKAYAAVADSLAGNPRYGARIFHNMGNSLLAQQNWQGAIDAYKKALLRNPSDKETKSNLAYAQLMLQNQQDQQQNQDQNKDQNQQDQNQEQNKDQNQDQNQDQNKDQNKDQNQNQDQDQKQDKDENKDQQQDQQPEQQEEQEQKAEEQKPQDEKSPDQKEVEALIRKALERSEEHENDKRERMRKAPLSPNERDW